MSSRFESEVVIGTGAETGIGAATARRFHVERAAVVMSGRGEANWRTSGRASARATVA
jgi:meso-butanediol dehydrogenase/(S,S)-butanediol dehydrogenase/diacetyl reductase